MAVQLLDCTLRDGAHVNSGKFGSEHILNIMEGLTLASVDIAEIGFLKMCEYSKDVSYYPYIEDAYSVMSEMRTDGKTEYSLMARADEYDINRLSNCTGKIRLIRVAFYYDFIDKAIDFAKQIKDKGYRCTLNLINTPGASVDELRYVVRRSNELQPEILTIVDTFGVLNNDELSGILDIYDELLDPGIKIGLHVHENLSSGFALAQQFIKRLADKRDIVVDSSLMGIGRVPGNLCTELISDYMNNTLDKNYELDTILGLIDRDIAHIKKERMWGYSPAYFLSAKHRVHRSYSEYLLERDIPLDNFERLLRCIDSEHSKKFDRVYMDDIIDTVMARKDN